MQVYNYTLFNQEEDPHEQESTKNKNAEQTNESVPSEDLDLTRLYRSALLSKIKLKGKVYENNSITEASWYCLVTCQKSMYVMSVGYWRRWGCFKTVKIFTECFFELEEDAYQYALRIAENTDYTVIDTRNPSFLSFEKKEEEVRSYTQLKDIQEYYEGKVERISTHLADSKGIVGPTNYFVIVRDQSDNTARIMSTVLWNKYSRTRQEEPLDLFLLSRYAFE